MAIDNESQPLLATENKPRPIKVMIVGDAFIGKTCLLLSYLNRDSDCFTLDIPGVSSCCSRFSDGENDNHIRIFDTAGQDRFAFGRQLFYRDITTFLVGFSVDSRASFLNVSSKWLPDIRQKCGMKLPIVLVGMKTDLRDNSDGPGQNKKVTEYVTTEEGIALVESEKMFTYVESSAFSGKGCVTAIKAAVEAGRIYENYGSCVNYETPQERKCCCTIL